MPKMPPLDQKANEPREGAASSADDVSDPVIHERSVSRDSYPAGLATAPDQIASTRAPAPRCVDTLRDPSVRLHLRSVVRTGVV